jgi:hypothetical protein
MNVPLIFAILGPLFLLLALTRTVQARKLVPQARAWLIVGTIFSLVALWLNLP